MRDQLGLYVALFTMAVAVGAAVTAALWSTL